jgi:hypothetical protein
VKKRVSAVEVVARLHDRHFKALEASTIEEVLALLQDKHSFESAFLREAMRTSSSANLSATWKVALGAWQQLRRPAWTTDLAISGYVVREALLEVLMQPDLLSACQAATISCSPPLGALAALVRDGSDESFDALIAEFQRVSEAHDLRGLKMFGRLRRYAANKSRWDEFAEAVDETVRLTTSERENTSFASRLGMRVPAVKFSFFVSSKGARSVSALVLVSDDRNEFSAHSGKGGVKISSESAVKNVKQIAA